MGSSLLLCSLVLFGFAWTTTYGNVMFSSLSENLVVTASPKAGQVLKAGEDKITVTWGLNPTVSAGTASDFKQVEVKLCFAPISQKERAWRKTENELKKDKTCQFTIVKRPYKSSSDSIEWVIEKDVPTATFFIRAYVHNSAETIVGFGQTTDKNHTSNLFDLQSISGRHVSIDIAAAVFSAFSVVSLFGFFFKEKMKAKKAAQKS